jgi:hypothetical protein
MITRLGVFTRTTIATPDPAPGGDAEIVTPSAARLLGLLTVALAILLLCWIYLPGRGNTH